MFTSLRQLVTVQIPEIHVCSILNLHVERYMRFITVRYLFVVVESEILPNTDFDRKQSIIKYTLIDKTLTKACEKSYTLLLIQIVTIKEVYYFQIKSG